MGLAESKVRTLNFRKGKLQLFKDLVDEIPGTLLLGIEELIGAGSSFRMFSFECKSSLPPRVRNQAGKAGNQHG